MEYQKKNFKFGEKVVVKSTNSALDCVEGTISGIAAIYWYDSFIVTLDEVMITNAKIMPTFSTITMPEVNLERILK